MELGYKLAHPCMDGGRGGAIPTSTMERHPWQLRAKEAGLSQKRLAELLGVSDIAVSKGLRGLWQGGVPRYIKLVILLWKEATPEQRRRVIAQLDASEKADADGGA